VVLPCKSRLQQSWRKCCLLWWTKLDFFSCFFFFLSDFCFSLLQDSSNTISYDEWKSFNWQQLLPAIESEITNRRKPVAPGNNNNNSAVSISGPIRSASNAPPVIVVSASAASAEARLDNRNLLSLPTLPGETRRLYCGDNNLTSLPRLPAGLLELHAQNNARLTEVEPLPKGLVRLRLDGCAALGIEQLPDLTALTDLGLLWLGNC
jgi:hypothetical protein